MSLARVWRRQLYGASSAALLVPCAMFAALAVLALGGGFSQIGVLGQVFAGPPAPSLGAATGGHGAAATRLAARALPVIPGAAAVGSPRVRGGGGHPHVVPVSNSGAGRTGGALAPVGGAAPVVTQRAGGGSSPRPAPAPPGSGSGSGSAASGSGSGSGSSGSGSGGSGAGSPPPQPTPVDQVVKVVTSVTQQVPAPAGPVVTQAVQAAGGAADSLIGPAHQGPAVP